MPSASTFLWGIRGYHSQTQVSPPTRSSSLIPIGTSGVPSNPLVLFDTHWHVRCPLPVCPNWKAFCWAVALALSKDLHSFFNSLTSRPSHLPSNHLSLHSSTPPSIHPSTHLSLYPSLRSLVYGALGCDRVIYSTGRVRWSHVAPWWSDWECVWGFCVSVCECVCVSVCLCVCVCMRIKYCFHGVSYCPTSLFCPCSCVCVFLCGECVWDCICVCGYVSMCVCVYRSRQKMSHCLASLFCPLQCGFSCSLPSTGTQGLFIKSYRLQNECSVCHRFL